MQLPIELRIDLKPGLSLIVEVQSHTSRDTAKMKEVASLLVTVARAVEQWQSHRGGFGCPMPEVKVEDIESTENLMTPELWK